MHTHTVTHWGRGYESKPDTEVGHEVDDGDDDITDSGEDTEQDVTKDKNNHRLLLTHYMYVCGNWSRFHINFCFL